MSDHSTEPQGSPGVLILLPVAFALALVAGLLGHWLVPLPLSAELWLLGAVLLAAGLGLGGVTVFWFRRAAPIRH